MRVLKSQCSIFKDLYKAFVNNEVDGETRTWMEQHMKECTYCRDWSKSVDEGREDIDETAIAEDNRFDEAKAAIRKARIVVAAGATLIVFAAVWMSALLRM